MFSSAAPLVDSNAAKAVNKFALLTSISVFILAEGNVQFVNVPLAGVPNTGVTNVGEVANTNAPLPVSSDITPANSEEDVAASTEILLVVYTPLVTAPAVKLAAVPDTFVITPLAGVPRAGVTNVGEVANTAEPEPVSLVNAVASCAEVNEPNTAAFPVDVICPVKLAFVVTVSALPVTLPVKLPAKPVAVSIPVLPTKLNPDSASKACAPVRPSTNAG